MLRAHRMRPFRSHLSKGETCLSRLTRVLSGGTGALLAYFSVEEHHFPQWGGRGGGGGGGTLSLTIVSVVAIFIFYLSKKTSNPLPISRPLGVPGTEAVNWRHKTRSDCVDD